MILRALFAIILQLVLPPARPTTQPYSPVKSEGELSGTIYYRGSVPDPQRSQITRDEDVCGHGSIERPLILIDKDKRVEDAIVFIRGIEVRNDPPAPLQPVVLNQKSCSFEPHVLALRVGQSLEVHNADDTAHNVNGSQGAYTLFNFLQPQQNMKSVQTFDRPGLVQVKCNIHSWMSAKLYIFDHPYFQKTGRGGNYYLRHIPPGEYQLHVWQEYLGEQTFKIKVEAGQKSSFNVTLAPR